MLRSVRIDRDHDNRYRLCSDSLHLYSHSVQFICIYARMRPMDDSRALSQATKAATLAVELQAVFGKLKRKAREQGGSNDWTPTQISVLLRLEKDGGAAVSSLARAEGMRPQSMSAVIHPLLEAGLLTGSPAPNDRRQTLMSLSKKCQRLLREGRAARQDWLTTTIQKKLSLEEQEMLATAVELLTRLAED